MRDNADWIDRTARSIRPIRSTGRRVATVLFMQMCMSEGDFALLDSIAAAGNRLRRMLKISVFVAATVAVFASLGPEASVSASNYGVELNGTYRVMSNGDWAKTNDVYINETTVVQTWKMHSSCTSPIDCTGTVTSDKGWSAELTNHGEFWVVRHDIENWEPCRDGTRAPGAQKFRFWGVDPASGDEDLRRVDLLAGIDRTIAPSGACGINKPLVIEMPMRLEKLS